MRWEFAVDHKPYSRQFMHPQADNMNTKAMFTLMVQSLNGGGQEEFALAVNDVTGLRKEVESMTKNANKPNRLVCR